MRGLSHVVGDLFIATAVRQLFLLFSACARGRFHARDGCDRARAENKKVGVWADSFYKQDTPDGGLYLCVNRGSVYRAGGASVAASANSPNSASAGQTGAFTIRNRTFSVVIG